MVITVALTDSSRSLMMLHFNAGSTVLQETLLKWVTNGGHLQLVQGTHELD
jgi:hypothetical protein